MDETRLQKLICSLLDESIDQSGEAELVEILRENSTARSFYLKCMSVHAELCSLESSDQYLDSLGYDSVDNKVCEFNSGLNSAISCATDKGGISHEPYQGTQFLPQDLASLILDWKVLAIAASLLIAFMAFRGSAPIEKDSLSIAHANETNILEEIEPVSDQCMWYVEKSDQTGPDSCLAGDVIRVAEGKLELTYAHGTKVVLHSPAAYQLLSEMESRMILGRLTATVAEAAKGFSVLLPKATVVDLGTQFGVEVSNDGASDVVVFEGEVDVDYDDAPDAEKAQRLTMGEAVHLDAAGTPSRVVSINGRSYSSENLTELSRPAIITEVQDNIKRESPLMNYYEIVHQGMQEDALSFVDRIAHQWNGIESEGIPAYLVGADYVKTFNSDKYNQDIEVSVTLDAPCKLYVFFDDRLTIPAWLSEEFKDTGDDIGLDEGPFFSHNEWHNRLPPGVGPGESVDSSLSIWVKEISQPTTYVLRATEINLGTLVTNMYGIAAAPLED